MVFREKNILVKAFFIIIVFLLFYGCATIRSGPTFQKITDIPNGKGVLYIYKPYTYGASIYDIYINGKLTTTLQRGGYFPYIAESGKNKIIGIKKARLGEILTVVTGLEPDLKLEINVEAGKSYFIERTGTFSVELEIVPEKKALTRIKETHLLPPTKIAKTFHFD